MKIHLGDEFDIDLKTKIAWIQQNFDEQQYHIVDEGFLIIDYYVEFVDQSNNSLYYLKWL
jgi:hypothetical protein